MYCTVFDVRAALTPGASANDKATAAGLKNWQIEEAIAEATGVLDLYLFNRYTYAVTEQEVIASIDDQGEPVKEQAEVAPNPVRAWTRNIAAYLATLTFLQNKDLDAKDPVALRYAMTVGQLQAVKEGTLDIPGLDPTAGGDGVHVENLYEGTLFGPEDFMLTPEGVVPSPNVIWPLRGWNSPW